tara:strand:- start:18070 stop:18456 length:387 start_codon:yes stop_codon:yes gene_type:complete
LQDRFPHTIVARIAYKMAVTPRGFFLTPAGQTHRLCSVVHSKALPPRADCQSAWKKGFDAHSMIAGSCRFHYVRLQMIGSDWLSDQRSVWVACRLMLSGDLAMLQASRLDGLAFDPFALFEDGCSLQK